jgi:hypothetical protein
MIPDLTVYHSPLPSWIMAAAITLGRFGAAGFAKAVEWFENSGAGPRKPKRIWPI